MNRRALSILSGIMFLLILDSCKTVHKNDPNFLGDFSPIELGTLIGGSVKRTKDEIKPTEFKFTFYPRTNIVSIQHKFMVDNVEMFLDKADREILINAMENYIASYNDKNLDNKIKIINKEEICEKNYIRIIFNFRSCIFCCT